MRGLQRQRKLRLLAVAIASVAGPAWAGEAPRYALDASIPARVVTSMAWSEDGTRLYVVREPGKLEVVERGVIGSVAPIATTEDVVSVEGGSAYVFDRRLGDVNRIDLATKARSVAWRTGPDANRVVWFSAKRRMAIYTEHKELKLPAGDGPSWDAVLCFRLDGKLVYEFQEDMPQVWGCDYSPDLGLLRVGCSEIGDYSELTGLVEADVARQRVLLKPFPAQIDGERAIFTVQARTAVRFVGPNTVLRFLVTGDEPFWQSGAWYTGRGAARLKGSKLELWRCGVDGRPFEFVYAFPESDPAQYAAASADGARIAAFVGGYIRILNRKAGAVGAAGPPLPSGARPRFEADDSWLPPAEARDRRQR